MASKKTTQDRFNKILSFKNDKEKINFEAEIISLDIMYETECLMKKKGGFNKSKLANELGVTKGYLTRLFTADKIINLKTLAKLQRIFNIKFKVTYEALSQRKVIALDSNFKKPQFSISNKDWSFKCITSEGTYEVKKILEITQNGKEIPNVRYVDKQRVA